LKTRILLTGLAAVVAMAFSASSALAVTVGPSGAHLATSGTATFKVDNFSFVCEKSTLPTVATNDGVLHGLIPTFTKCNSYFGYETVTASYKEPTKYEMAFDQNGLNTTVRGFNLAFSNSACKFNVTGYESTTNLGLSPLNLSDLVFPNDSKSPATMTLSSFPESNHCFNFLTLNSPVEFSATYKFPSPLVVTK
jgi:hypothetical protein